MLGLRVLWLFILFTVSTMLFESTVCEQSVRFESTLTFHPLYYEHHNYCLRVQFVSSVLGLRVHQLTFYPLCAQRRFGFESKYIFILNVFVSKMLGLRVCWLFILYAGTVFWLERMLTCHPLCTVLGLRVCWLSILYAPFWAWEYADFSSSMRAPFSAWEFVDFLSSIRTPFWAWEFVDFSSSMHRFGLESMLTFVILYASTVLGLRVCWVFILYAGTVLGLRVAYVDFSSSIHSFGLEGMLTCHPLFERRFGLEST